MTAKMLAAGFTVFLILSGTACAQAPAQEGAGKCRVLVVFPFRNNTADAAPDPLSLVFMDEVTAQLTETPKPYLKVVERKELEKILAEQKLALSGVFDQATAAQMGKLLGANAFVLGGFQEIEKKLLVTARVVDVETGEILFALRAEGKRQKALKISKSMAKDLSEKFKKLQPKTEDKP